MRLFRYCYLCVVLTTVCLIVCTLSLSVACAKDADINRLPTPELRARLPQLRDTIRVKALIELCSRLMYGKPSSAAPAPPVPPADAPLPAGEPPADASHV